MLNPWQEQKGLKCVVLCAGRGTRLIPHTEEKPKVLTEINGKPLIRYVVDYWSQFTEDFIFIVGYKKDMVMEYTSGRPVNSAFIEQNERRGIAHAILHAENDVNNNFIVVLGDCICKGEFQFPEGMAQGVGVWATANQQDIRQSYSVEIEGSLIKRVVEKPKTLVNNYCGMGFYFFRKELFDYIRKTSPSPLRNEVEITDVIQRMIDAGESLSPVWFDGAYINVTFPEDIERARLTLSDDCDN